MSFGTPFGFMPEPFGFMPEEEIVVKKPAAKAPKVASQRKKPAPRKSPAKESAK